MAQFKMNAYDADVFIPRFKGLISNGNDPDGDLQYAVEAENVDTTDGFLQPLPELDKPRRSEYDEIIGFHDQVLGSRIPYDENILRYPTTATASEAAIEEWFNGSSSSPTSTNHKSRFNSITKLFIHRDGMSEYGNPGNILYVVTGVNGILVENNASLKFISNESVKIVDVVGLIKMDGTYDSTYREMVGEDEPESDCAEWETVLYQSIRTPDILEGEELYPDSVLLSSKEKGLYLLQFIKAPDTQYNADIGTKCVKIETPAKFEHIEIFGERLWGCSSTEGVESLYYSAVYDPTDWKLNTEHPEVGAGQINQPSFDNDRFTALKRFGDTLIAFKRNRVLRISGVDISSMYVTEQYGIGTEFGKSIVSSGQQLFFANLEGIAVYDGSTTRQLLRDNERLIWKQFVDYDSFDRISEIERKKPHGFLYGNRKYCVSDNYDLFVLDMEDGSVMVYRDIYIKSFCNPKSAQIPDLLISIPRIRGTTPGSSYLRKLCFNGWDDNVESKRPIKWVTPWIELGRKDVQKGGFDFYFTPEVKGNNPVTFTITFQTEKKKKTKQYTVQPMTAEELAADKKGKTKRIHFGGSGRRFRVIIETINDPLVSPTPKIWRLYGGIHIIAEVDKD